MSNEIEIVVTSKDKTRLNEQGKQAERLGSKLKTGIGLGAATAGLALLKFGKDSASAFIEAEQSQTQLEHAFQRFPKLADVSISSLQDLNSELAKKTKFDDDATASGQAVLAQFGLTGTQIKQLTPLLQDYAAKTGKDIPTAARDLGKAVLGQGRGLKAIGVNFKDTGSAAGNFGSLVDTLNGKVGGFAEKQGKSAAGQAAILENRFGEIQETVGAKLVPAMIKLFNVGTKVVSWVDKNSAVLIPLAGVIGTVIAGIKAWTIAQAALNIVMALNPIGLVVIAIAALAAGLVIAWKKSEKFREVVTGAFDKVKGAGQAIVKWFREMPGRIATAIGNTGRLLYRKGVGFIDGLLDGAADKVVDFGKFLGGLGKRAVIWVGTVTAKLYRKGVDFIDGLLDGAAEKVVDVASFFMRLPGRVLIWIGNLTRTLAGKGAHLIGGLLSGLGEKWAAVTTWLGKRKASVLAWIGNTLTWLKSKGGDVLQGFLDGLKSKWEGIKTWVGGIATWIKDHKGPVALDRKLLVPAGQAIMDGFLRGLKSGAGPAWDFVSKVGGKTVSQLRSLLGPQMIDLKPGLDILNSNGYLNRVKYQGESMNLDTFRRLQRAESMLGRRFRVFQGSFEGASSYSGTTHTGGGVVDVNGPGGWSAAVNALRRVGFAAWHRTPSQGPWNHHIHAIAIGDPTASASARDQVADYLRGGDGLAGMRHGGITGGRRLRVGEGGPEILDVPAGAHVRPGTGYAPAGGGPAVIELRSDGGAAADLVLELLRKAVQPKGGNVQLIVGGRAL